jgi:hypothetical protein
MSDLRLQDTPKGTLRQKMIAPSPGMLLGIRQ